jgi:hypothetical protein
MGRASGRKKQRRRSGQQPRAEPLVYGFYGVAFVDLLGQQDELQPLLAIPHHQGSREAILDVLRRTAGRVRRVRERFGELLAAVSENHQAMAGLSAEQIRDYNRLRTLKFHQVGFSDSFVISVPLGERAYGAATPAVNLWAMLYGVAGMSLAAMAEGIPIRAGIDVERGVNVFPQEVYGPALVNAYNLECRAAEYPRAVIGAGLLKYINYLENVRAPEPWGGLPGAMAQECRRLICAAPDDQRPMLHFLSSRILRGNSLMDEAAASAYRWATQELVRFTKDGDQKLAGRYGRLVRYFDANGFGVARVSVSAPATDNPDGGIP